MMHPSEGRPGGPRALGERLDGGRSYGRVDGRGSGRASLQPSAEAVVLDLPPYLVPGYLLRRLLQELTHALALRGAQRGVAAQGRRGQLHRAGGHRGRQARGPRGARLRYLGARRAE
eukprot:1297958-Pyramimonas_sp.AAC.1